MLKGWIIIMAILTGCAAQEAAIAEMYTATLTGPGQNIGVIRFNDTPQGLKVEVDLHNLPAGAHGFHIHENGSCRALPDKDGQMQAALGAGGHFDPDHTGKHLGPEGRGHRGDLPVLMVADDGTAKTTFYLPQLKTAEIVQRAVIIHAGGDNYADTPQPLGGGGARIACGIIE